MGNDLRYIRTPKEEKDPILGGCHHSTWVFLTDFYGGEEKEDMDGITLDKSNTDTLRTILLTAEASGNSDLADDMRELIEAIKKYESITLVVRG